LALNLQDPNAASGELLTSVGVTQGFGGGFPGGGGGGQSSGQRSSTSSTTASNGQALGYDSNGKVIGVHDLTGQVTAISDPNTNSLIIVTTPDNLDLVKNVVDQLDKIPEQVMIQTIIVEATLDKAKQFGLEWSYAQKSQGITNSLGQNFGLQSTTPALQGLSYALSGGDLTGFFNMLQTDSKYQVLSTPRIFTSNNMEAQINISQSIPYVVSTVQSTTGTYSYNYAFQDVGIVLTVTPHVTSNGYVTMDVTQTANDLQGYTSFNAPIVNQREAETTVSAKDGETIILGGMIRNQITATVNKIPLLGDIPVLGNLFRNTSKDNQKTELLVFLTPHVVRDPAEAKKLKDESERQVSPDILELLNDQTKSPAKGKAKG
jgi:general secretion pathway protein D